jgi:hypothetical protein
VDRDTRLRAGAVPVRPSAGAGRTGREGVRLCAGR